MKTQKERAAKKLQERNFKLNTLLEVSNAINTLEYDFELYERYREILSAKLSLGKVVLLSDYNGWSVNIKFGVGEIQDDVLIARCMEFTRITVLNHYTDETFRQFDVVIPIFHKQKPLSYLLLGDFEGEKIEVSPIIRHLPFIQTLTNLIVVAQENRRLFEESIEKAAMQKELELTSRLQNMLIPKQIPERLDLDIEALYKPHQVVGGDYYDFFQVNEEETVFCMADVSGKGMSAALLMSNFQAMMHAMIEYDRDLNRIVTSLNQRVASNAGGEKFVTAFIAVYHHGKKELTYVNSGHQPALFCHEGQVLELSKGSTVLGAFDELPILTIGTQKVSPDDCMVCFTDGICEVVNTHEEEFGTDVMKNILTQFRGRKVDTVVKEIMREVDEFRGEREYPDDLALLSVRFI